jgi:RNA polymerase sigma factor (sigma-70 family)
MGNPLHCTWVAGRSDFTMSTPTARLLARLDEFVAFARKRTGDPDLAADAVQESFLKAMAKIDQLEDEERVDAWFYRILRNVIVDLQRARSQRPTDSGASDDLAAVTEDQATACACVTALVDDLPPAYARALRTVDLEGVSIEDAAAAEGITPGNLKVRRHRAREELRGLVQATCKMCAAHGCLDCTCKKSCHTH